MTWSLRRAALALIIAGCGPAHYPKVWIGRQVDASWSGRAAPTGVNLEARAYAARAGDTAIGLCVEAHLVANADAIELLRGLNPQLDLDALRPGQVVHLPVLYARPYGVVGKSRFEDPPIAASPIEVRVDSYTKATLGAAIASATAAPRTAELDDIAAMLGAVRERLERRTLVTTPPLLAILEAETAAFARLAAAPDPAAVARLAADLRAQTRSFGGPDPVAVDEIAVDVRAKPSSRIWYRSVWGDADGTPLGATLPPGTYEVWADATQPRTIEVRGPMTIDL